MKNINFFNNNEDNDSLNLPIKNDRQNSSNSNNNNNDNFPNIYLLLNNSELNNINEIPVPGEEENHSKENPNQISFLTYLDKEYYSKYFENEESIKRAMQLISLVNKDNTSNNNNSNNTNNSTNNSKKQSLNQIKISNKLNKIKSLLQKSEIKTDNLIFLLDNINKYYKTHTSDENNFNSHKNLVVNCLKKEDTLKKCLQNLEKSRLKIEILQNKNKHLNEVLASLQKLGFYDFRNIEEYYDISNIKKTRFKANNQFLDLMISNIINSNLNNKHLLEKNRDSNGGMKNNKANYNNTSNNINSNSNDFSLSSNAKDLVGFSFSVENRLLENSSFSLDSIFNNLLNDSRLGRRKYSYGYNNDDIGGLNYSSSNNNINNMNKSGYVENDYETKTSNLVINNDYYNKIKIQEFSFRVRYIEQESNTNSKDTNNINKRNNMSNKRSSMNINNNTNNTQNTHNSQYSHNIKYIIPIANNNIVNNYNEGFNNNIISNTTDYDNNNIKIAENYPFFSGKSFSFSNNKSSSNFINRSDNNSFIIEINNLIVSEIKLHYKNYHKSAFQDPLLVNSLFTKELLAIITKIGIYSLAINLGKETKSFLSENKSTDYEFIKRENKGITMNNNYSSKNISIGVRIRNKLNISFECLKGISQNNNELITCINNNNDHTNSNNIFILKNIESMITSIIKSFLLITKTSFFYENKNTQNELNYELAKATIHETNSSLINKHLLENKNNNTAVNASNISNNNNNSVSTLITSINALNVNNTNINEISSQLEKEKNLITNSMFLPSLLNITTMYLYNKTQNIIESTISSNNYTINNNNTNSLIIYKRIENVSYKKNLNSIIKYFICNPYYSTEIKKNIEVSILFNTNHFHYTMNTFSSCWINNVISIYPTKNNDTDCFVRVTVSITKSKSAPISIRDAVEKEVGIEKEFMKDEIEEIGVFVSSFLLEIV